MKTKQQVIEAIEEDGLTISLLLTEQCNFKCRHCFYSCGPDLPKEYMGSDILTAVADQIALISECIEYPNIRVNLIGGEPTLNLAKFKEILSRVFSWLQDRIIASVEMTTNGSWLHEDSDTIAFLKVISEVVPENYLGLENGFTIRVSNDSWHDEFRPNRLRGEKRLEWALGNVWDNYTIFPVSIWCYECNTEFDSQIEDGDPCPIKKCNGFAEITEELLTYYLLPDPEEDGTHSNWIYAEKHNADRGMVSPLGRGEGVGCNDKCKMGGCHAGYGGYISYIPDGTLHDICSSGSRFPARTVHDDPFELMAMAMDFGGQQVSCYRCHESAEDWIGENTHKYKELT